MYHQKHFLIAKMAPKAVKTTDQIVACDDDIVSTDEYLYVLRNICI